MTHDVTHDVTHDMTHYVIISLIHNDLIGIGSKHKWLLAHRPTNRLLSLAVEAGILTVFTSKYEPVYYNGYYWRVEEWTDMLSASGSMGYSTLILLGT